MIFEDTCFTPRGRGHDVVAAVVCGRTRGEDPMVRRAVVSDRAVDSYAESSVTERPPVASLIARVVTVVYVAVVSLIGLDALFRALDARQSNGFVAAVHDLASPLTAPFRGMFDNQQYWAGALIAVVVYTIAYLIAMAVLRHDRTY
jgi:hypothetical protein